MFSPSVQTVWWLGFASIYEVRFSCLTAWRVTCWEWVAIPEWNKFHICDRVASLLKWGRDSAAVVFAWSGLFVACLCYLTQLMQTQSVRLVSPIYCFFTSFTLDHIMLGLFVVVVVVFFILLGLLITFIFLQRIYKSLQQPSKTYLNRHQSKILIPGLMYPRRPRGS